MKLYHTSDKRIESPDISFSRAYLDFGKGFYMTPNQVQAEKYAKRFFKEGRSAFLNTFELDDHCEGFTIRKFAEYDGNWLDYVVACRKELAHDRFDIIEGGIADDDVFNTLDLYMAELIPREEAIKRLRKKKPNWQICLCNQQLIDKHLHFVESKELKNDES
ncbi:MAG: DUF3990 domain-containing protein [Paludibacteraceae bacterium]|nr:DUF3990 domain-containing protein [Paludibacteraceae bacterium]